MSWDRLVTLNWNVGTLDIAQGRRFLKHWDAVVSSELFGRRWSSRTDRPLWAGVIEHVNSNAHHHLVVNTTGVGEKFDSAVLSAAPKFPGASFHVSLATNPGGAVSYITKDLWQEPDRFTLSAELR